MCFRWSGRFIDRRAGRALASLKKSDDILGERKKNGAAKNNEGISRLLSPFDRSLLIATISVYFYLVLLSFDGFEVELIPIYLGLTYFYLVLPSFT